MYMWLGREIFQCCLMITNIMIMLTLFPIEVEVNIAAF